MSGSAATFSPTCFIVTRERAPAYAAPAAASSPVFSFVDHSTCTRPSRFSRAIVSSTSVDGVPG